MGVSSLLETQPIHLGYEEFEETWEDAQCLATVWLGASIGSLLLSIHGPYLATVSGFLGILGFASFLTPRPSSRIAKSLWPSMLMAATTSFLSSIIAGFCLGYLVALHRGCADKAAECQMYYEIFLFNFCWYAFTTAISVAVFRELSSLKDTIVSMREAFECAQHTLVKAQSI